VVHGVDENGEAVSVGYARVDVGGVVAAVEIPASAVFVASQRFLRHLLLLSLALLVLAVLISASGSRQITKPLEGLLAASRAIGRGEFDTEVDVRSSDEIGSLAMSFNHMATELKARDNALESAQSQLIQSEKLAALGELGAAIAHEVKNPLAGILACAQLSMRKIDDRASLERNLSLIDKETKRCKAIVENLLKFARADKPIMEDLDANQIVTDTASILRHQLNMHSVNLEENLSETSLVFHGNANQVQQVIMNLVMNAQQAMDGGGNVVVSTAAATDGRIVIEVADDGPGMPPDVQARVFEPFYTTKPRGEGTGLGLSVSFGIIRDHGGAITLESEVGRGTTFRISLPPASARGALGNTEHAA